MVREKTSESEQIGVVMRPLAVGAIRAHDRRDGHRL
jgi:hypothetical protein